MTTTPRPNFFILLELNPNLAWNQALFDNAVNAKRNEWSRQGAGVARKALAAKQNLALIPAIQRVMSDPTTRDIEARAAIAELNTGRKVRQGQFEQQLAFINAKESVELAEVNKFIADFKDILSEQEIKDRILVKVHVSGPSASTTIQPLDITRAREIADLLQMLHLPRLYELLERSDKTATPDLCRAAEALYTDMTRRPPTAEVTIKTKLAGLAKDVFKSHAMRERYDETLRLTSIERLLKELDDSMNRTSDKEIHLNQVDLFLNNAQKEGWARQEAMNRLRERVRTRKWSMVNVPANAQKMLCPNCKQLNDKIQRHCTNCTLPLFIDCPSCGQVVSCEIMACGNCGFPAGNRYLVDTLLQGLPGLLNTGDIEQAEAAIQEAEQAWQSGTQDQRTRKINEYKNAIKLQQHDKQKEIARLERLTRQKRFFEARKMLTAPTGRSIPRRAVWQRTIDDAIAQAQTLVTQALTAGGNRDQIIELYRQALILCADYTDAQDLLNKTPPSEPGKLQASTHGNVISLSWERSTTQGVAYKLVRKQDARPNSVTDGTLLDTISGLTYDDSLAEIGLPLYYAVFSALGGVISDRAAHLVQSVILVQDISQLVTQVDSNKIILSWEPPTNVHRIIIVRKEQSPPTSLLDGIRIAEIIPSQKQVIDQNVQVGQVYHYAIYCQFKDAEGGLLASSGTLIEAKPEAPPAPIMDINLKEDVTGNTRKVHMSWHAPGKGTVIILKSDQPLHKEGQVLSEANLGMLGTRLQDQPTSVTDEWIASNTGYYIYYTPVVLFRQMAYVGPSKQYACVENVSHLRATKYSSAIRLQWDWPEDCQEVQISYSLEHKPQLNDPTLITHSLSRSKYNDIGWYEMAGMNNQKHYILVSAIFQQGTERIESQGAHIEVQFTNETALTYEIKNSTFLGKRKRTLHIKIDPVRTLTLPTLLLRSRQHVLPTEKTDGNLFHNIDAILVTGKEVVISLPNRPCPPATFGMLFFEEDTFNDEFRIYHPGKDRLRLG